MPVLSRYCKAYPISSLRAFSGWGGGLATPEGASEDIGVVFLHPDFRVTRGVYADEDVLFADIDDGWCQFCRTELGFAPPAEDGGPGAM